MNMIYIKVLLKINDSISELHLSKNNLGRNENISFI